MSHAKERAEKVCLNCNAELNGRFCHVCGQENTEPRHSVWGIVSHFFYDITHFDGKFFGTLKHLIAKPGIVSLEYIKGKRARYLDPVRMYVFSSALFFIIFFALFDVKKLNFDNFSADQFDKDDVDNIKAAAFRNATTREDSMIIEKGLGFIGSPAAKDTGAGKTDSATEKGQLKGGITVGNAADEFNTVAEYDSAQRVLPADRRDGWFESLMNRKFLNLKSRYRTDGNQLFKDILDKFLHSLPALLFVSLPLYALYLRLLYIRRKQYYYVDHGIFLIHLYIFTFIFLLIAFGLYKLHEKYHLGIISWLLGILVLYGIYYAYRSMRNFYRQGRIKTVIKFILFNILAFATVVMLFGIFFSISVLRL